MPVFDFANDENVKKEAVVTYTTFKSDEPIATAEKPILVLADKDSNMKHHTNGTFTNPISRSSFEYESDNGVISSDILRVDSRFVSLIGWLGENHIPVRLSGVSTDEGYSVYKIRETATGNGKLSSEDGFLQLLNLL